jgi:type II secretory pathway component PulF
VAAAKSLSQALDTRREIFSRFYVNIVRAGEAGAARSARCRRASPTRWSATRTPEA